MAEKFLFEPQFWEKRKHFRRCTYILLLAFLERYYHPPFLLSLTVTYSKNLVHVPKRRSPLSPPSPLSSLFRMHGGSAVKIYLLSPLPAFWCEAMLNQIHLNLPREKPLPPPLPPASACEPHFPVSKQPTVYSTFFCTGLGVRHVPTLHSCFHTLFYADQNGGGSYCKNSSVQGKIMVVLLEPRAFLLEGLSSGVTQFNTVETWCHAKGEGERGLRV